MCCAFEPIAELAAYNHHCTPQQCNSTLMHAYIHTYTHKHHCAIQQCNSTPKKCGISEEQHITYIYIHTCMHTSTYAQSSLHNSRLQLNAEEMREFRERLKGTAPKHSRDKTSDQVHRPASDEDRHGHINRRIASPQDDEQEENDMPQSESGTTAAQSARFTRSLHMDRTMPVQNDDDGDDETETKSESSKYTAKDASMRPQAESKIYAHDDIRTGNKTVAQPGPEGTQDVAAAKDYKVD
jgi:hypothetical protein